MYLVEIETMAWNMATAALRSDQGSSALDETKHLYQTFFNQCQAFFHQFF